ncbi:MAG: D-2-hydroxyacid dehydrogenase [Gammaproteobacteria bacterium]
MPFRTPTMQGVFLDLDSVHPADLDLSALKATLGDWRMHPSSAPGDTAGRIAAADVVVSNKVRLSRDAMANAPGLKLVCVAATGTNNVDLDAARDLGVAVTNVTGYGTPSVVQHVFALVLALTTRLEEHRAVLDFPVRELAGKTLGIVGYGELGRGVARVAEAFGMHVLVSGRPGQPPGPGRAPLERVLAKADVLSLHVPLAENTRHLIGSRELSLMKSDALLINTARGGIVDERALWSALEAGTIGGAALDVLEQEPPLAQHPLLDVSHPRLIVTPHVAWAARESRQRLIDGVAANVRAFLQGEERNRVV